MPAKATKKKRTKEKVKVVAHYSDAQAKKMKKAKSESLWSGLESAAARQNMRNSNNVFSSYAYGQQYTNAENRRRASSATTGSIRRGAAQKAIKASPQYRKNVKLKKTVMGNYVQKNATKKTKFKVDYETSYKKYKKKVRKQNVQKAKNTGAYYTRKVNGKIQRVRKGRKK